MTWSIRQDGARTGGENMAVDRELLAAVGHGDVPPTLRLYRWRPRCVSLGKHQSADDVPGIAALPEGTDWVRRPSGGKALLHDDEVTYAVIVPVDHPLVAGTVRESYRRIGDALRHAMHLLGANDAEASAGRQHRRGIPAACYLAASTAEIVVGGRKLIGSAQVRADGAVLQHGSVPLTLDHRRLAELLLSTEEQREQLVESMSRHATSLSEVLGRRPDAEDVERALLEGFRSIGVGA